MQAWQRRYRSTGQRGCPPAWCCSAPTSSSPQRYPACRYQPRSRRFVLPCHSRMRKRTPYWTRGCDRPPTSEVLAAGLPSRTCFLSLGGKSIEVTDGGVDLDADGRHLDVGSGRGIDVV